LKRIETRGLIVSEVRGKKVGKEKGKTTYERHFVNTLRDTSDSNSEESHESTYTIE
jgi:hypothetical protein